MVCGNNGQHSGNVRPVTADEAAEIGRELGAFTWPRGNRRLAEDLSELSAPQPACTCAVIRKLDKYQRDSFEPELRGKDHEYAKGFRDALSRVRFLLACPANMQHLRDSVKLDQASRYERNICTTCAEPMPFRATEDECPLCTDKTNGMRRAREAEQNGRRVVVEFLSEGSWKHMPAAKPGTVRACLKWIDRNGLPSVEYRVNAE